MRISDWSSDVCSSDLPCPPSTLDRVIHLVLQRMRRGAERGDFLHLQPDVGVDEIVGHHAAGLEELAVGVERLECLVERVAHGGDVLFLLGRQVRSEEHTSELQSLIRISSAVFCLKQKKAKKT